MKKITLASLMLLLFVGLASAQPIPTDSLYIGETPPGNTPKIFAPGVVSITGRGEYGISFSPDGKELFFIIGTWPNKRTMFMEYKNDSWTGPDTASFSKTRSADEAIFSPDGQRVYYYAYNAPNSIGGADLCYSEKSNLVWGEPINLGPQLNTAQDEYHPCVVADGSIYFENTVGKLCYSKYQSGAYEARVLLPAIFNDPSMAWGNIYVSPDESYRIFNSTRAGGFGNTDLYISYHKIDGSWTNPKNLGNKINTPNKECGSEITADGAYLTYMSNNDIYWVNSSFIDSLKHTNFAPYSNKVIPSQTDTVGELFNYTIADSTFIDDDGNNTLTYSAQLNNGNALPTWLTFNSTTLTFSGTPLIVENLNIKVIATDTAGATASTTFVLSVKAATAIEKINWQEIKVFPNPTTGLINVSLGSLSAQTAFVEICNLEGKIILKKTYQDEAVFDLSEMPKGIYIVKLIIDNDVIVREICVE